MGHLYLGQSSMHVSLFSAKDTRSVSFLDNRYLGKIWAISYSMLLGFADEAAEGNG